MKGALFALATVLTWALMGVVNRYCVSKYGINVLVFTSFLIFSGGVALLLIRERVNPENWMSGVHYSWLYTTMQMTKSFFMISTYLYITTTETSLLINIEVVLTYLMAYLFFKRVPHKREYWGIAVILIGFLLLIYSLPTAVRIPTAVLILLAATASCIRSIVVEQTSRKSPETTVRQKCGISGYTMFVGGTVLIVFFFGIAGITFLFGESLPKLFFFLNYLPQMTEMLNPETVISGCLAGFFLNSASVYWFYAALKWTKSETFMAFRVFQPILTYTLELLAALFYAAKKPELSTKDFFIGGIILLGSVLILIVPSKTTRSEISKNFITE